MTEAGQMKQGPPYAPTVAGVGGRSTPLPDVPISAVLLVFYVASAAANMTIFQLNNRKTPKHKFLPSALLFGFSMARILTLSLRMGSAYHPHNISLSIASGIFVNAGILIVYIINLIFVQRILRARQPHIGWAKPLRIVFKIFFALIGLALALVITFTVISFYTLDMSLKRVCLDVQRAAITYLLVVAFLPLPILALSWILPAHPEAETFGDQRSMKGKSLVLAISASLCTLGAGFKAGANWMPARPVSDPAWYQSKACFYIFYFVLEILILMVLVGYRVDQAFHVPDGSSKRNSFGKEEVPVLARPRPVTANTTMSSDTEEKEEKDGEMV